jgi:membrane-bound lytic murein transglycosylase B
MRIFLSCGLLFLVLMLGMGVSPVLSHLHAQELSDSERAELEEEYDKLQEEIQEWEKVLAETRVKKNTLQGDVTLLNAQIQQAEAQIRQKNLSIGKLSGEIKLKTAHISELSSRIDQGHDSLASLLRRQNQVDDLSLVEIALAADNAFALFEDVDSMASIQIGLHEEFADIRVARTQTEEEKKALALRQDAELDARYVVETKKQQVAVSEAEKQRLLSFAKTEESAYQKVLADRQAQASQIRARLFPLRDTEGIQFGDAVEYAKQASAATGVRPALILAILKQESDLGTNVGNCYVTNSPNTGDGVGKNTGTAFSGVMHPERDVPVFIRITEALGKDPKTTAVSCPQPGGWGGAMGPTQFIPSTWALFEPRLKNTLGVTATNPWNAGHAIMATALYLADWGAGAGTYTAERKAAGGYYAGSGWATRGLVYANSVLAHAEKFQEDIDFLKDN